MRVQTDLWLILSLHSNNHPCGIDGFAATAFSDDASHVQRQLTQQSVGDLPAFVYRRLQLSQVAACVPWRYQFWQWFVSFVFVAVFHHFRLI